MTKNSCCGRGILAFEKCKPARRPGERLAARLALTTSSNGATSAPSPTRPSDSERSSNTTNQPTTKANSYLLSSPVPVPPVSDGKKPVRLLAKYNYKANPNRPGGFDELSLKQAEKLEFIQAHPANPFWWEARNGDSLSGYVPASYVMVLEEKPSSLPWLEQKREVEQKEQKNKEKNKNPGVFGSAPPGTFKPYISAYNKVEKTTQQERQWYCELCCKQLNGPTPYQAHLVSRGHKDELEAQGLS